MTYKKKNSIINSLFTVFVAIALFFSGILFGYFHSHSCIDFDLKSFFNTTVFNADNKDVKTISEAEESFYYSKLNKDEKKAYEKCYETLTKNRTFCFLAGFYVYKIDVDRVCVALINDHPEFFWLENAYFSFDSGCMFIIKFTPYDFCSNSSQRVVMCKAMDAEVNKIFSGASQHASDYEKAKYVHDYLIKNVSYAHEELQEYEKKGTHSAKCETIFTAYGALVEKRCVCAGYASAYSLIMSKLGIATTCISGKVNGGGNHAWNAIKIDGKWLMTDCTWDDYDNGVISHEYFCLEPSAMAKNHEFAAELFENSNQ